jgi:hypothetical protein
METSRWVVSFTGPVYQLTDGGIRLQRLQEGPLSKSLASISLLLGLIFEIGDHTIDLQSRNFWEWAELARTY